MENLTVKKPMMALVPMLLSFFMIMVDTTIVNIAIPTLLKHFNTDLTTLLWVNSAYMLAIAVPLLLAGRLGDRFGQEKIFLLGVVIFTLASAWCGFSRSVEELIIARTVQGLGSALLTPQTMAMISKIFPPQERGKAMGLWGAVAGVATIFGPLIGGVIVDYLGWEWIFFVNIPFGILALVMGIKYLPKFEGTEVKLDFFGIILSGIGLFCLTFGVQEGSQYNWGKITGEITVPRLIIVGIIFLLLFLMRQRSQQDKALLPLKLFGNKNFNLGNIAGFCSNFTMVAFTLPFTIYLQSALGMDPTKSALVLLPMSLVSGICSPIIGKMSEKIQPRLISAAGFFIFGVSLFIMDRFITAAGDLLPITLASLLAGVGLAGMFAPIANIVTQSLPMRDAGAGSGAFNTFRQLGGVFGGAVVASVMTSQIKTSISSVADAKANNLPEAVRPQIIEGIKNNVNSGDSFSSMPQFQPPAGVPEQMVQGIKDTVGNIVKTGLSDAASHTLIMPLAALVIGVIASLAMNNLSLGYGKNEKETSNVD